LVIIEEKGEKKEKRKVLFLPPLACLMWMNMR